MTDDDIAVSWPANTTSAPVEHDLTVPPLLLRTFRDHDAENERIFVHLQVSTIPDAVKRQDDTTGRLSETAASQTLNIRDLDEQTFAWKAGSLAAARTENAPFTVELEIDPDPWDLTVQAALSIDAPGYRVGTPVSFTADEPEVTVTITPPNPDGNRVEDTITLRAALPGSTAEVVPPLEITVEDVHALPAADAITAQAFTDDEGRPSRTGTGEVREGDLVHVTVTVDRGAAGYPLGEDLRVALELAAASEAGAGDYRLEDVSALETFGTGAGETSKTFKLRTVADDDVRDETLVFDLVATGKNPVNGPGESVGTFSIEIVDATEKQVRPRDDAAAAIDAARGDGPLNPGGSFTLDVGDLFEFERAAVDVTYSAEVDDQAVADAEVTGTELTVTAREPGDAHVTVKATAEPRTSSAVSTRQQAVNVAEVRFDVRVVLRALEVTLSPLEARLTEGEEVRITATANRPVTEDTTIRLEAVDGSAARVDYTLEETITIAAGETTGAATLTAVADDRTEGDQTLVLQGVLDGVPLTPRLTFTIQDPEVEPLTITLSAPEMNLTEGDEVTVTATANRAVTEETVVRLSGTGESTAAPIDYTVGTITIAAGETTGAATLTARTDDEEEGTETLMLRGTVGGLTTNTLGFMIADPLAPLSVMLSADPASLTEGGSATVTATANRAVEADTAVRLVVTAASTAAPADYTLADSIVIAAGETAGTATLTAVADENDAEGDETLVLQGSVGSMVTDLLEITISDPAVEALVVTLSAPEDRTSLVEGESVTVTATANRAVEADTTVRLEAVGASTAVPADYALEHITIAAGETTGAATLTAAADADPEGSETLMLRGAVGGLETNVLAFTLLDPLVVTLSASGDGNVTEGGEPVTVTAAANRAVEADTPVRLKATGASTAAPADYTLAASITIAAGATRGTAALAAVADDDAERSETLVLQGLVGDGGMETNTVTLTLWDAAVPALPVVASLLLAALLAVGGCRRYLRR